MDTIYIDNNAKNVYNLKLELNKKQKLLRREKHEEQANGYDNSNIDCSGIIRSGSDACVIPAFACSSCFIDNDFWGIKNEKH